MLIMLWTLGPNGAAAWCGSARRKSWRCCATAAGDRLTAFVEIHPSSSALPAANVTGLLRQWCRDRLPLASVPSTVVLVTQLPRSSAGKLQRSRLKELAPSLRGNAQASPITEAAGAEGERSSEPAPASRGRGTVAGSTKAGNESVSESASRSSMHQSPAGGAGGPFTGVGGKHSLSATSEADVVRAFQSALGGMGRGFEPNTDFWAAGGDSIAAMQARHAVTHNNIAMLWTLKGHITASWPRC